MGAAELRGLAWWVHLCRRAPFVLAIGLLAALTTVPVAYARRGVPQYQARVEFAVHPAPSTPAHRVADAMRVLESSGAVMGTVAGVLRSDAFRAAVAARASVAPGTVTVGTANIARADVVAATVRGTDRAGVAAMRDALPATAQQYMARVFDQ